MENPPPANLVNSSYCQWMRVACELTVEIVKNKIWLLIMSMRDPDALEALIALLRVSIRSPAHPDTVTYFTSRIFSPSDGAL
jgi:hypothetical protein